MRIPIEEVETDPLAMSQVIIDEMIDDPLADHDPVIRIDSIKSEGGPPIYLNENSDDFEPVEAEAGGNLHDFYVFNSNCYSCGWILI